MDDISIEAWAAEERKRIDRFVAMWKREAKEAPEHWPMAMPIGEWDEQYRSFDDGEE